MAACGRGRPGVTRSHLKFAGVGCRKIEHGHQPGFAVGAVVGEGLAGPFAADEDAASGVAEVLEAVSFAPAQAGHQLRSGVLGLDAVAEPVRARRRAGLVPERLSEPGSVGSLAVGVGGVAAGDLLGQVFGEVADAPAGVFGPGQDALGVELGPEPGDVQRFIVRADGVEGLVPGRQDLPGRGVEVVAGRFVPDGQLVVLVPDYVGGPPDLVVGGGDDGAQVGAGDGAAEGDVGVRGESFLGFDGGEVLDVVAEVAAQVLDEPVEQGREVDRVPGGPLVVVAGGVGGGAVRADFAVAVAGEGEEHRRPPGLAVRCGEHRAGGAVGHRPLGQVGGVLAAAGRPGAPLPRCGIAGVGAAGDAAADTAGGELVVQFGDELVELGHVVGHSRWLCRGGPGRAPAGSASTPASHPAGLG